MTPFTLTDLTDLQTLKADTIIDVRAPTEFAQDHIPGAINLPVLNDTERATVGTIYAQESPFNARKIGGALVAQNTAAHLRNALADKDGGWQPLVYCWRGGQRSGAFATILSQVGWRVQLLQGGYRSYRRAVVQILYDAPLPHRLMLIEGGTGTAKTALLHQLSQLGAQVLDLEAMADHRGSLFGAITTPQPAQRMFESRVARALTPLDPDKLTFIEAESSKIGQRIIPPSLWTRMGAAPRLQINAPLTARAQFLCRAYTDLTQNTEQLGSVIDLLRPYHAASQIAQWQTQAEAAEWQSLAASLIGEHYDPRYIRSAAAKDAPIAQIDMPNLEDETLAQTAKDLIARFT
ncbi:tRNA 2-selenouridine(34) synthase MnmH [Sulfitobacter pacificus]|uniref:tRNA 2-selenouridine synthase n=1 Tax=Sulfitobacter pacificus TaxID=1499314 RepID=A0ABQ5VLI1_9RHOB|nr:tRNA 2-selenouridine(34) synthase MnmH [Sulfitobacter pacificus]GLQ27960.1 tRNA 2-selenouridine synthase [Sulfitobacter pacificus]